MPREFGQVDSAAWRDDDDWRDLPADAQWLYMLLVSQADLSAAGVLTLAASRWQRMCADMGPERFTLALAALEGGRFVFVDFEELELLIRTFARRKTQWNNPRRRVAVKNAAGEIHSARLRLALAVELHRHGISVEGMPAVTPQAMAEFSPEGLPERLAEPFTKHDPNGSPIGSRARASQTPDARRTDAQTPDTAPTSSTRRGTRIPEPFVITEEMRSWARGERMPDEWADRVTESFVDYWRGAAGSRGVKLDWPSTWRNWLRRESERTPPRSRSLAGNDRFAGHLALIDQLPHEEGA